MWLSAACSQIRLLHRASHPSLNEASRLSRLPNDDDDDSITSSDCKISGLSSAAASIHVRHLPTCTTWQHLQTIKLSASQLSVIIAWLVNHDWRVYGVQKLRLVLLKTILIVSVDCSWKLVVPSVDLCISPISLKLFIFGASV